MNSNLTFLISHYKIEENQVIGLDYFDFKRDLYTAWNVYGFSYFQVLPIKEVLRGSEYDADLVIFNCNSVDEQVFVDAFHEVVCRYHIQLGVHEFKYTINDITVNLKLGG